MNIVNRTGMSHFALTVCVCVCVCLYLCVCAWACVCVSVCVLCADGPGAAQSPTGEVPQASVEGSSEGGDGS